MIVPFLNIPILSVVLMLLAGILIGHLIWYRDRSDDEALLTGLRNENNDLQSALHEHKQAYVDLESDLEDRQKEWEQLRASNKQVELDLQEKDQHHNELETEIARLQQLKDQAFHDLDQERQQRRELQATLTAAEENVARSASLSDQLQSQVASFQASPSVADSGFAAQVSEERDGLLVELEQLKIQRDELAQRVRESEEVAVDAQSKMRAECESVELSATQLQAELKAKDEKLLTVEAANENATAQYELVQQELAELRESNQREVDAAVAEAQAELTRLEDELAQAKEEVANCQSIAESTSSSESLQQEIEELRKELSQATTSRTELESSVREELETEFQSKLRADWEGQSQADLTQLQTKLDAAQQDAETHKAKLLETSQLETELSELKQSLDRTTAELAAHEENIQSLRVERDELTKQVDDERSSREQLESKLPQVDQLVLQRDEAMARATKAEEEIQSLQTQLNSISDERQELMGRAEAIDATQANNEELKTELETLRREHEAVATMLVDERARLSRVESDNHRLSLAATERTEQNDQAVVELKEQLETQTNELVNIRKELEETAARLGGERHQREHLQEVLDSKKTESDALQSQLAELQLTVNSITVRNSSLSTQAEELSALRGEHESVKRILASQVESLTAATKERDSARAQLQALEADQETAIAESNELRSRAEQLTEKVTQLGSVREQYGLELSQLQGNYNASAQREKELQATVDRLEAEHTKLIEADRERLEEIGELQVRIADTGEMQEVFNEQQDRLNKVIAQRDEAMASKAATTELIRDLREQIESQSRSLSALNQQYDQSQQRLVAYDEIRRDHLKLQTQMNETSDRLRRVTRERDGSQAEARESLQRLTQIEAKAKSNEETIRNLRRERAVVLSRSRPDMISSIPFASRSVPEDSGGRMRRDEVLGMVYTQPPKQKDDLKRISGIAQVLEKKLNAFGIYTYRQIMEWDSVAVAEFSKLLSFRDRIDRDDWRGQARNMHFELYGRAA